MTKMRRSFTDEFKREAVALLDGSGRPLEHVARELGLQPSVLRNWRRAAQGQPPRSRSGAPAVPGAATPATPDEQAAEIARLRRELERARQERDILKKANQHLLGSAEMRFRFVEDHRDEFPVRLMCTVLGVSASGYYAWRGRPESDRAAANRQLLAEVRRVHGRHQGRYGSPRVHAALRAEGVAAGRGRVARLMRRHGIRGAAARRFRPATTDSRHGLPVAPDLLGQAFRVAEPNRVWLADITYLPTGEGWLYLAAVLDLATRKVVGWAMRDHMRAELATSALVMAIQRQRPPTGLIQHSDRGSQYASRDYRDLLQAAGMRQSMSRKGCCYDNAPMESFFHTLKVELVHRTRFETREQARRELFAYIETYYNRQRAHSAIGYITPEQAELRSA
ncbi:IS3 family transposase (plasmid) [Azospirillum sp. TSH58]|uniref:IS3 family transposase n=1 Tax=Azospirillum sp. TSH58 TaxID=664962 RepID=UPI000D60328D|nr:IS3 family transposase [Azospirillum sp. TSH58]AWJ88121.1 IS3 family transposase [Azospirillum sp. TSH58]